MVVLSPGAAEPQRSAEHDHMSYQPQYIRDTLLRMKARLDAEGLVPDQQFLATLVEYVRAIEQGSASWSLMAISAEINRLRREQWRR